MTEICLSILILIIMLYSVFLVILFIQIYALGKRLNTLEKDFSGIKEYLQGAISKLNRKLNNIEPKFIDEPISQKDTTKPETTIEKTEEAKDIIAIKEEPKFKQVKKDDDLVKSVISSEPRKIKAEKPKEKTESKAETKKKEDFLFKDSLESYIGGRLLNRIGAIALIIGLAFLLKYSFDKQWINETVRVLLGVTTGAGLIAGGLYSYKKDYMVFSQGLLGAGIATLYLSVYGAYNFYEIIPYSLAIFFMVVVTICSLCIALYCNSMAIAILGILGGFLTPFLMIPDTPSITGLLIYIMFINLLTVALLYLKDEWRAIEFIGFISTSIIYCLWYIWEAKNAGFFIPLLFIAVVWTMYFNLNISRIIRNINNYPIATNTSNILFTVFYYMALYLLIENHHPDLTGIITFVISGIYFAAGLFINKNYSDNKFTSVQYMVGAITLLTLGTEIEFTGFTTISLFSIEALLILACGIQWNKGYAWKSALVIFGYAFLKIFIIDGAINYQPIDDFIPIFNIRSATFLILAGTLGIGSIMFNHEFDCKYKGFLHASMRYAWITLLFFFILFEADDYFDKLQLIISTEGLIHFKFCKVLTISLLWTLYSLPLIWYGLKHKTNTYKIAGSLILIIGITIGFLSGYTYKPIEHFIPILNVRFLIFALMIASLIWITTWIKNYSKETDTREIVIPTIRYTWAFMLFLLFTIEVNDFFNRELLIASGDVADLVSFSRPLILSLTWSLFSLWFINIGLTKKLYGYLILGLAILFLSTLFSILPGITFEPTSLYMPFFNYRFLSISTLIIAYIFTILWIKKERDNFKWSGPVIKVLRIITSVFLFLLFTYEFSDIFKKELYLINSDILTENLLDKQKLLINLKQLSLSVLWLVYSISLMIYGFIKKIQVLRVTAIFFFGLSIFKIFIFDLSFLDQLYRIFSFIGLGVILLTVSYLYGRYKHILLEVDND